MIIKHVPYTKVKVCNDQEMTQYNPIQERKEKKKLETFIKILMFRMSEVLVCMSTTYTFVPDMYSFLRLSYERRRNTPPRPCVSAHTPRTSIFLP